MNRERIWVTGAGGLIGNALVQLAPRLVPGRDVRALQRATLDLNDFAAVERRFAEERPAAVVHCAGLTRGPACEADPALARRLNVDATALMAGLCGSRPFVFLSTDLVFDGRKGAYTEGDAVGPLSVYAATKAEGERRALGQPGGVVVRTSLNYGHSPTGDRAFNEELARAWRDGRTTRLFVDEFRCPIGAEATAGAVWELLAAILAGRAGAGVYHLAGAERLSRFEIGRLVSSRHPNVAARIEATSLAGYDGPPRPPDTSLDCRKIGAVIERSMPRFGEWLATQPVAGS